jgi:hypothetical protein
MNLRPGWPPDLLLVALKTTSALQEAFAPLVLVDVEAALDVPLTSGCGFNSDFTAWCEARGKCWRGIAGRAFPVPSARHVLIHADIDAPPPR